MNFYYFNIATITIFLLFTNECVKSDKDIAVAYDTTIQLNCTATDNVEWYKVSADNVATQLTGSKYNYVVANNTLTINRLKSANFTADYYCNTTTTTEKFIMKAIPYFYDNDKATQTVSESGTATFGCRLIVGFYKNVSVTWLWLLNNIEVNVSDARIGLVSTSSESILVVKKLVAKDEGRYTCVATNQYGNNTQEMELRVKNALAALWPFCVILVEVIILCAIIFICEKKCTKKTYGDDDDDDGDQTKAFMAKKDNSDLKKRVK